MTEVVLAASADELSLTLPTYGVVAVNAILAVIMFGVGLDLDLSEFRRTLRAPRGPAVGLVTQFLLLPALAYGAVRLLAPEPAVALGVLLVCACPGGTVSNVITHLADANVSLSIAMTTVSTFLALVATPANLAFWGSRVPALDELGVRLDPVELTVALLLVMGLPVLTGVLVARHRPAAADRLRRPMRVLAVAGLLTLIVGAGAANLGRAVTTLRATLLVVVVVNAGALALGYGAAAALRLPVRDRRAVSIEVGIQNSALALTLALQFFGDLGAAALVAATWGLWHMVTGLALARLWRGRSLFATAIADTA